MEAPDAASTGPAPGTQGRNGSDFAADGRRGRATRCRQWVAGGNDLGGPENVESANRTVGKADQQFVSHSLRSSEHSGDPERTGQYPSNECRASARAGFQ